MVQAHIKRHQGFIKAPEAAKQGEGEGEPRFERSCYVSHDLRVIESRRKNTDETRALLLLLPKAKRHDDH